MNHKLQNFEALPENLEVEDPEEEEEIFLIANDKDLRASVGHIKDLGTQIPYHADGEDDYKVDAEDCP